MPTYAIRCASLRVAQGARHSRPRPRPLRTSRRRARYALAGRRRPGMRPDPLRRTNAAPCPIPSASDGCGPRNRDAHQPKPAPEAGPPLWARAVLVRRPARPYPRHSGLAAIACHTLVLIRTAGCCAVLRVPSVAGDESRRVSLVFKATRQASLLLLGGMFVLIAGAAVLFAFGSALGARAASAGRGSGGGVGGAGDARPVSAAVRAAGVGERVAESAASAAAGVPGAGAGARRCAGARATAWR